jgi:hypothetical protein
LKWLLLLDWSALNIVSRDRSEWLRLLLLRRTGHWRHLRLLLLLGQRLALMVLLLLLVLLLGMQLSGHQGSVLIPPLGRLLNLVVVWWTDSFLGGLLLLLRLWAVTSKVTNLLAYPAASVVGNGAFSQVASVKQVFL